MNSVSRADEQEAEEKRDSTTTATPDVLSGRSQSNGFQSADAKTAKNVAGRSRRRNTD
jgi:hypothetical protein